MKLRPEDGNLSEITASCLNSEFNVIIIQRPEETEETDRPSYTFATLDRTREGVEWPGDLILEKLIPDLPKVKAPKLSRPEVMTKTDSLQAPQMRRKFYQQPVHKNNFATKRRPKPPQKKFRTDRSENSFNDIDPWVCKPWENQTFLSRINPAASVSASSLISNTPFNNFYAQTSASSLLFPPRTSSNFFNIPNSSNYEKNIRSTAASNIPFITNPLGHLNRPTPTISMPVGPPPSFPLPNRLSQHPDRGFCGPVPTPNVNFNGPSQNTGLFGENPAVARYQVKHGLLGDRPFPNVPFNRNLSLFPNSISTQSNPEGNSTALPPRDEKNIDDQNNFISNTKKSSIVGSYDNGYGRIPRSNFNQYKDSNETSEQESYDSYEYPNNPDDSRNNTFKDASKTKYNRFHNSGNSIHHYEDQYKVGYNHLNHNRPKNNNQNIFLNKSRDSHKANYGRFKKPLTRVNHSQSDYKEMGDGNLCENSYNDSQISSVSKTTFMNNQNRNTKKDSLIHISASAVVYDPEDFQNDEYPAATSNFSASRSNVNSGPRSDIRQNIHTKNTLQKKRRWSTNNNYRKNRVKYNQGQQRFGKWRTPQK